MKYKILHARPILFNREVIEGTVLKSPTPISPLGDIDPKTGEIIDPRSTIKGQKITEKILVAPYFRGSTVGSYVLFALAKYGTAPKAIIVGRIDPMLVAGCVLGNIPLLELRTYEEIPSNVLVILKKTNDEVEVHVKY